MSGGPLAGTRILELGGIGPAPFAGMVLADLGAELTRITRPGARSVPPDLLNRGKRTLAVDLRQEGGAELVLDLVEQVDVVIEGFRPGVTERLGVGPEACQARNAALVYGRVTGWGQDGPLAAMAGHDINYIGLAGVLAHVGRPGTRPLPPLNLVGDFGGGGMLLVVGVLAALLESRTSGRGQVVDAAMVDGAALQMMMTHDLAAQGLWTDQRGTNLLDGGAPFYDTYETSDGGFVAVGALEPQFFAALVEGLGWDPDSVPPQMDIGSWPALRGRLADAFRERTRDEWAAHFDGTDACVTPVLTMSEAAEHHHNVARASFRSRRGTTEPAPAPRFSRSVISGSPLDDPGAAELLRTFGVDGERVGRLIDRRIVEP